MFAFKDLPDGSLSKLRVPLYNYISLEKSFKTTEFERNSVVVCKGFGLVCNDCFTKIVVKFVILLCCLFALKGSICSVGLL